MNIPMITIDTPGGIDVISYSEFVRNLWKHFPDERLEICHAAMGVSGEAGELCDALKNVAIYGKELDRDNIVEELGDLRFFMQAVMNRYQVTDEELLNANGVKLEKRYKDWVYTDEAAIARADKVKAISCYRIASTIEDGANCRFVAGMWISAKNAAKECDPATKESVWIEYTDGTYELTNER